MDYAIIIAIIIIYNLLVHTFASYSYRDLQYDDKIQKTATFLLVAGIVAFIIAKFVIDDKKNAYNNENISMGLKISGILLVLTSFCVNWEYVGEETKIVLLIVTLGYIVYYSYDKKAKV